MQSNNAIRLTLTYCLNALLVTMVLAFTPSVSSAQGTDQRTCGTMAVHDRLLATDPEYRQNQLELEILTAEYARKQMELDPSEKRGVIIIPVVVHVVWNTTAENISDAQINSQINVLNEDFRKLNADWTTTPGVFQPFVTDAQVEFQLAVRDANCNATTGITRTYTTVTSFSSNDNVKYTSSGGNNAWPMDKYLNIWVCDLGSGLLGYAQFPGGPAATDGVVIDYEAFGNIATAAYPFDDGRTATHEIGHWLNLRHIWGDDGGGCTGSDGVADTPNQGGPYGGCPTHPQTSCGSDDMFMNYMDYVDDRCMVMFTDGQSVRADAALFATRQDILASDGLIPPTGAADLWSADTPADIGDEPNTTILWPPWPWLSDDIWVRNQQDGFANQQHQNPEYNISSTLHNYVYVRVRNRGCVASLDTPVELHWAKASPGLSWPQPWDGSLGGSPPMGGPLGVQQTGIVAAGGSVVLEFVWDPWNPALYGGPEPWHFCLISRIDPTGMTSPEGSNLSANVINNNNTVWKNVEVVDLKSGRSGGQSFSARNARNSAGDVDLEFRVPDQVFDFMNVKIDLNWLFPWQDPQDIGFTGMTVDYVTNEGVMTDPVARISNMYMQPWEEVVATMYYEHIPKALCGGNTQFKVDVLQYYDDSPTPTGGISQEVTAGPPDCPTITIEKTHGTYQGQFEYVSITTENTIYEMGGFDFLIAYDASALAAAVVTPGQLLEDCGWEYFTYRHGPFGNCGDACPSGLLRIIALAETNNGPNHPICYGPPECEVHELANMKFLVTNDRTFEGHYLPIRFFWLDCGDNTYSSKYGDSLFVSDHVYDFEGTEITDSTYGFPTYFGVQIECLEDDDSGKPIPIRCPTFVNGGVDIIPAEDIDDRGDINLNGVVNEVADAVLYSNYFVHGISVFNVNIDGQIAASDVNADGITLSVADLVYLIRIITGDALPYPKLTAITADADLVNGVLSVDADMGAAYVVVERSITPQLLAESMEMKYQYDADHDLTRILVYSMDKGRRFTGDFLGGIDGNVITLEMATYEGAPVTTKLVPDEFALYPSFPNPFNPVTTISFALASLVDYELVIYNALGQTVKTFGGHAGPGLERIDWNASGFASGVYFYRLTAGDFTDTKKMVLLK